MRSRSRLTYGVLLGWSVIVLGPVWVMVINSFKRQREIFANPAAPPRDPTLDGYREVLERGGFDILFRNTIVVTGSSIAIALLVGSMAALALSQWRARTATLIYLGFVGGLMIPIRLATIDIVAMVERVGLLDRMWGLIPVYVAMSLPVAVFVLRGFIDELPHELFEAAHIDGAGEWRVYYHVVLPTLRPALSTVAILALLPIWNDIWFPLILTRSIDQQTLMLGVTRLFGQYTTDWTVVLSVLTLAALPVLALYVVLNRQFIHGLTTGAIKG